MVNQQKQSQVDNLSQTLTKSSNFIFVKFEKTNHQTLEKLRKELKKNQAKLTVIKNSLLEKSINKLSTTNKLFADFRKKFFPLKESTAVLMLEGDWGKGLNAFYQFMSHEKTLSFKFGTLDKALYSENEVARIAQLPGKDQLMAKIIGSMKSPISKLVYAMKFNTNKFVYILQAKSKSN